MGGLHSQKAPGTTQVNQIDGLANLRCKPAAHVEKRDWIQRPVAEHGHIDITVGTGLASSPAPVEPCAHDPVIGEGRGNFVKEHVGKAIERDHGA